MNSSPGAVVTGRSNFEKALALVNVDRERMSVEAVHVLNEMAAVHTQTRDLDVAGQSLRRVHRHCMRHES